jgi:chaperone modulatory protein CbpM
MPSFEDILRIHRLQRIELQTWIEHRWVRPRAGAEGMEFDEADEARIELIRELRQEFLVDDDALEVVLPLLDQLYATRLVLRKVEAALQALPAHLRDEVRARLRGTDPVG